jgi:hypothetical protein
VPVRSIHNTLAHRLLLSLPPLLLLLELLLLLLELLLELLLCFLVCFFLPCCPALLELLPCFTVGSKSPWSTPEPADSPSTRMMSSPPCMLLDTTSRHDPLAASSCFGRLATCSKGWPSQIAGGGFGIPKISKPSPIRELDVVDVTVVIPFSSELVTVIIFQCSCGSIDVRLL